MNDAFRRDRTEARHDPHLHRCRRARAGHGAAAWRSARWSPTAPRTRTAIPRCSSARARASAKNMTKAERGHFAKAKVEPKRKLAEFRVSRGRADRGRRRDHRRPFRRRPVRRRHRHLDRQGLCRRHEALEFRRPARHARRVGLAPLDRLDRRPPGSRQDVQEQEDGRPHGRRTGDHAESQGRADRCRARPDHGQGRGARRQGRLDHRARRGEEAAAEGRAEARQVPLGGRPKAEAAPAAKPRQRPPARRARDMELEDHHPRRQGRPARSSSAGRDLRPRAARRHPAALRQLAARQAPARHPQDQGSLAKSSAPARRCTRRRAPAAPVTARRSAPQFRGGGRAFGPVRAQPRHRPAEEGARARAQARALVQGQGRRHHRARQGDA